MRFQLKVLDNKGMLSAITLDAQNQADAQSQANLLGYSVLSINKFVTVNLSWISKSSHFDLLLFSQELVALLNAGLSLVVSVETLLEKSTEVSHKAVLQSLLERLHEGQTFSQSVAAQPEVFPELLIAMIKASEKTGDLKQSLQRYVLYRSQLEQVRTKLITASIYPVMLMAVGALVSIFLLGYVVPKFSSIYENVGDNIPFLSRVLMHWGNLLHEHGIYALGAALLMMGLLSYIFTRKQFQIKFMAKVWSIPSLGEKFRLYLLARFYRTLGMLLQGGIPLVTAMQMAADVLGNTLFEQLQLAVVQVKEGKPLSIALEQNGLATAVSKRMMSVGEQAGNMGEMMESTASFYDQEIARWVDWVTRLIEPLLMTLIGLIIGGIVVLMYLPIFELADSIQ